LNVGLLATGDSAIGNSRFEGGLGGKVYSVTVGNATVGNADVLALALGGQVRCFSATGRLLSELTLFYAPHVVTLLDGQRFFDVGVRAESS